MESLRVLRVTRQTAIRARRNALQLLRMTIVAAPEELRDQVRNLTRMQLIRTCAAWRPETTKLPRPGRCATRIALKILARRILELGDEIAALDELIKPLVTALAPQLLARRRDRDRGRRSAAGHRRRQPRPAPLRGQLRHAVRRRTAARLVGHDPASPAEPWRGPASQLRTAPGRDQPHPRSTRKPRPTSPRRPPRDTPSSRSSAA